MSFAMARDAFVFVLNRGKMKNPAAAGCTAGGPSVPDVSLSAGPEALYHDLRNHRSRNA